jgi:hypothetical protein
MTSADDDSTAKTAKTAQAGRAMPVEPADHAGSVLCRLLVAHPEVAGLEMLGQLDTPEGIIYSLGVMLPDGRELLIDVGYV